MPVEIKELLIRVSIAETQTTPGTGTNGNSGHRNAASSESREDLLKACMEQTEELLQQKKER